MIVTNLYENFLRHTNLKDGVYKAIFLRIQDVFTKINQCVIKQFFYKTSTDDLFLDFIEMYPKHVEYYIPDMIRNVIEDDLYALPKDTEFKVLIEYNGADYELSRKHNTVSFQGPIDFFLHMKLFKFLYVRDDSSTYSKIFDNLFSFVDNMKDEFTFYPALKDLFSRDTSTSLMENHDVTESMIPSYDIEIQKLQNEKDSLILSLEALKKSKAVFENTYSSVILNVKNKSAYQQEYESLKNDFIRLRDYKDKAKLKVKNINEILLEIDANISVLNEETSTMATNEELKFLLKKKEFLLSQEVAFDNTITENSRLLEITKKRMIDLDKIFESMGGYTSEELTGVHSQIENVERKQEEFYSRISLIDAQIKKYSEEKTTSQLTIEKGSFKDSVLDKVGVDGIPQHLLKPEIPLAIIAVKKYLKYFFVYHCEKIEQELSKQPGFIKETSCIQIPTLVLQKYFGFNPSVIFTKVDLQGFKNIILVGE